MKNNLLKTGFLLFAFLLLNTAHAQLALPAPSPKASVMQTVGLTEITIEYSSPGVKGRTIWGGLLPYDSLWRAGANAATKITFSKPVTINGTAVPAGSYSIFMIPGRADWTVILNKNAAATPNDYKKSEDFLRLAVKPETIPNRERLQYSITDFSDESAKVNMEWGTVRVPFTVNVTTHQQAMDNINARLNDSWRDYTNAARYMVDNKKDLDLAQKWIDQSIALSSDQWLSHWVRAQILNEKKQHEEAYKAAQRAKELGDKAQFFFFKTQVEEALAKWPKK